MTPESQVLYQQLKAIVVSQPNIKKHIDIVAEIRTKLYEDDSIPDLEHMNISNRIRSKIQREMNLALDAKGGSGAIYSATGSGKSKVIVDRTYDRYKDVRENEIFIPTLLVVPTVKLRDKNWLEEYEKWGQKDIYEKFVTKICYASMHKYKGMKCHLVLDEGHNLTETNEDFFKNNDVQSCIVLTATRPNNATKLDIFKRLEIKMAYELTMPDAIKLGICSPYNITVITVPLDDEEKYLKSGNKEKGYFYQTEKDKYRSITNFVYFGKGGKFAMLQRMKMIHGFKSKRAAAKRILDHIIPQDIRTLIFCGGREQTLEMCDRRYFSKPTIKKTDSQEKKDIAAKLLAAYEGDRGYNDFRDGLIPRLACVEGINEGHNLGDIDCLCIIQLNKQQLDFVQRAGRIRFRPNVTGEIIVLVSDGTIDVQWASKSMRGFDHTKIKWVTLEDIRTRKYIINFKKN
jgi:superfamily II DNA or RNA helicase